MKHTVDNEDAVKLSEEIQWISTRNSHNILMMFIVTRDNSLLCLRQWYIYAVYFKVLTVWRDFSSS